MSFDPTLMTFKINTNSNSNVGKYSIRINATLNDNKATSDSSMTFIVSVVLNPSLINNQSNNSNSTNSTNSKPYFLSLLKDQTVYVNQTKTYTLPPYSDNNASDLVVISIDLGQANSFIKIVDETTLVISPF